MTDDEMVKALAEALHASARVNHNIGEGPLRAVCQSAASHEPRASYILAVLQTKGLALVPTETAEVGEAVLRLPVGHWLHLLREPDGWWKASLENTGTPRTYVSARMTDPDAAIDAALRGPQV